MCVRVPPVISTMIYSWARSTVVGEEAQVMATTRHDTPLLPPKDRSDTNRPFSWAVVLVPISMNDSEEIGETPGLLAGSCKSPRPLPWTNRLSST